jgi:hypothetical protein
MAQDGKKFAKRWHEVAESLQRVAIWIAQGNKKETKRLHADYKKIT